MLSQVHPECFSRETLEIAIVGVFPSLAVFLSYRQVKCVISLKGGYGSYH